MNTILTPTTAAAPSSEPVHVPAPLPAPPAPSIHVRAVITWLAIFPLVAVGMTVVAPLTEGWHLVLRALVLTLVVVPMAVYLVLPRLFAGYGAVMRRSHNRKAGQ